MAKEFGFVLIGYVEEKPGIPPSAGSLERLVESIKKTRPDGILTTPYYGRREVEAISRMTGVKAIIIPHDVGSVPGATDWFSLMDTALQALK
jgi:ABC-type Zn uptake system ZnuABC Zn-binding protein ZnuA